MSATFAAIKRHYDWGTERWHRKKDVFLVLGIGVADVILLSLASWSAKAIGSKISSDWNTYAVFLGIAAGVVYWMIDGERWR